MRHLQNTEDDTYPVAGVRAEIDRLKAAPGFAGLVTLQEQPGGHYVTDAPGSGTTYDIQNTLIRPRMAEDWQAPAG